MLNGRAEPANSFSHKQAMDTSAALAWLETADERILDPTAIIPALQVVYFPYDSTQCLATFNIPTTASSTVEWGAIETALGRRRPASVAHLFQAGESVRDVLSNPRTPEGCMREVGIGENINLPHASKCLDDQTALFIVGAPRPRVHTRRPNLVSQSHVRTRRRESI